MGFRQAKGIADINKEPKAPKQEEIIAPVEQVAATVISEPKKEADVGPASIVTELLEEPKAELAKEDVAVETKNKEVVAGKKPAVKKKVTSTKKTKS